MLFYSDDAPVLCLLAVWRAGSERGGNATRWQRRAAREQRGSRTRASGEPSGAVGRHRGHGTTTYLGNARVRGAWRQLRLEP